jgi:TonB-linked SusC/RagA family outer membrane protein
MYKKNINKWGVPNGCLRKIFLIMRLTTIILMIAIMQLSASTFAQRITLSEKNAKLTQVFDRISDQSGYDFVFTSDLLKGANLVTINVKHTEMVKVLDQIFSNQPLSFSIEGKTVVVKAKETPIFLDRANSAFTNIDLRGRVVDEQNNPLTGATVTVKGSRRSVSTNSAGEFFLANVDEKAVIVISYVGFVTLERPASAVSNSIRLFSNTSTLDEMQIIGYGTTSKRLATGSVSTIKAVDIAKQPISNVLAVLAGKIPGMKATQSDGIPGSSFDLVIRGRNSLTQNFRPLILIDGIPFSNESSINNFPSANFANSPLSLINPGDIESIDVLKDADATSIYGSRGANGVILITTKRGKPGTQLSVDAYTGITTPTYRTEFLNTEQYLEMRREGFKNDNIAPTTTNAPDLLIWDNNRYTNFTREFRQNSAIARNLQTDLTGGSQYTQFRVGVGYHYETPSYAKVAKLVGKEFSYQRSVVSLNTTHRSVDDRFRMSISAGYSFDRNDYSSANAANLASIAPNAPYPIDQNGNLVWTEGGASFANPLGSLNNPYYGKNSVLTSSTSLSYILLEGLQVKVNGGFNTSNSKRLNNTEKASQNPASNATSGSNSYETDISNWQVEPMLQYDRKLGPGNIQLLAGASWNSRTQNALAFSASGYFNESLFGTNIGATSSSYSGYGQNTIYRNTGTYARINYNIRDKYILNLTGRRDGSTRFGPNNKFANFGAVGATYIFAQEKWVKKNLPFLSFGKLRSSFGITGNDNIREFGYLEYWLSGSSSVAYPGTSGLTLYPDGLFNPDFSWEKTKKLEAALELGFFKDRLLLGANYYRSRSGNQLINYTLPAQVGPPSILRNFDALIQNSGWEFTLTAVPVKSKVSWTISANATIANNKLLEFPNLAKTSYASSFAIGESISRVAVYDYTGIDPQTGLYTFNGNTRTKYVDPNRPRFYGGLTNTLLYKHLSLDVLAQFSRLQMRSYATQIGSAPGTRSNQPVSVLNRWQQPNDVAEFQRFATSGAAADAYGMFAGSTGAYEDASFLRIRNVSLSYLFDPAISKVVKMRNLRIYFQGQNLAVFSKYKDADPENAGIGNPLLRVYTLGLQASF